MGKIATAIKEKLTNAFNPSHLEVRDESHKHAGHAGAHAHAAETGRSGESAESHFHVIIQSNHFEGMTRLAKHRAVLEALEVEMKLIHAFSLEASAG